MSVPSSSILPLPRYVAGLGRSICCVMLPDDDRAGGIDELLELLEMLVDVMARRGAFPRRADEQCALDGRREGDQIASDERLR